MATELEELVIKLTADTDGLRNELKTATLALTKSTTSMEKSMEEFSKNASSNTSIVSDAFSTMAGFIGGQVVIGAFTAIKDMLKESVGAAIETEQATQRLSWAMASNGDYSKEAANNLGEFADEMERLTGVNDSTVLSMLSLAKVFGRTNEEAKVMAQAALDLAAATGVDANTAIQQLGMTLDGSAGRLAKFVPGLKDMSAESLKAGGAIDFVAAKFAGAALANASTLGGALAIMGAQFENIGKSISKAAMTDGKFAAALGVISNEFGKLSKFIDKNADLISGAFTSSLQFVMEVIRGVASVMGIFEGILIKLTFRFQQVGMFADMMNNSLKAFLGLGPTAAIDEWNSGLEQMRKYANSLTSDLENNKTPMRALAEDAKRIKEEMSLAMGGAKPTDFKNKDDKDDKAKKDPAAEAYAQSWIDASDTALERRQLLTEEMNAAAEVELAYASENGMMREELELAFAEAKMERLAETQQMEHDQLVAALEAKFGAEYALNQKAKDALAAMETKHNTQKLLSAKEVAEKEKQIELAKLQALQGMFGGFASLMQVENKELFAVGKAAAVAEATISTYLAANKAFAAGGGWPLGAVFAAASITAGLVNVSKIMSTNLATGIDEVPGVGNRDNFPAMLAPGERVVPKNTNQDLKEFLTSGGNQGGSQQVEIQLTMNENLMDMIEARIIERRRFGTGLGV